MYAASSLLLVILRFSSHYQIVVYGSGSQPGLREKSGGVRQIFISLRLLMKKKQKWPLKSYKGVREFSFFCLEGQIRLGTIALGKITIFRSYFVSFVITAAIVRPF